MVELETRDSELLVQTQIETTTRRVQCVGPAFFKVLQQLQGGRCSPSEDVDEDSEEAKPSGPIKFEDDVMFLRSLDPKEWKQQDHYAVLGIKWLRHKATDDIIKQAYRAKVLRHHPDKRKAAGEEVRKDDDYFTCISKAWEILGTREKRRSYDSVDPLFDDTIPSNNDANRNNFFQVFGPVFDRNARWSEKKPVPKLGTRDTPREQVERFYNFWYSFNSWREYSYLDEDEKDKGQDREERRYIDKQNKAARAKLKKEEMTRVRSLVDLAYDMDPRIAQFQADDKEKKLAFKRAKQEAAKMKVEQEERAAKEAAEKERMEKEKQEQLEKERQISLKQEQALKKRQLKQKRKLIRDLCKANNYYTASDSELIPHMEGVEHVCELLGPEELVEMLTDLNARGREALVEYIARAHQTIASEKLAHIQAQPKEKGETSSGKGGNVWTTDNLALLIKAVNLFPAGTTQRWEVVAAFINQHATTPSELTAKEVLAKAKDLQSNDFSLKESANKKAFDNFEKDKKVAKTMEAMPSQASERFDTPAEQQGVAPWTTAEQQLLEQALRTYGAATPDRWDQIALCVPGRSKKECMKRFKELAEMVKAKKLAQAAAKAT